MLEIQRLKEAHSDRLCTKQGVVGVGVGHKWADGCPTGQPAIIVFVEKKRTKRGVTQKFSLGDVIPTDIDGIPTDVIEVGKLVKHIGFQQRVRPIKPGFSCGQGDITAGTIGGIFLDKDGDPVILSNNHVLANENRAKIGDLIYQPGPYDAGGTASFQGWTDPVANLPYIGTLKRFVTLNKSGNLQDSAIAVLHEKIIKAGLVDALYPVLNRPVGGFGEPTIGTQVQKCGRTTGYTTGRVLAVNGTFTISYDQGPTQFTDCMVLTAMSKGGDSGSLIMDMGMKAVGHLFAGSPKVTLAIPISYIVNEYGLKIWSPAGVQGVDTLDFGDSTWHQASSGGIIEKTVDKVTITAKANQFCYLESPIGDFNAVEVIVNTSSDQGATWGPGLTVVWPTGTMKVNVRHNNKFGGYFNGTYNINIGTVKPNTDYSLRIRKSTANTWVGEVKDGDTWHTVIELPRSIFPHPPVAIRVGKNDLVGGPSNHTDAGADGTCIFRNFVQN
jgi:hypothetical protein